ncbi:BTAD domain-containing protein [Paenibacillus sp. Leaf72]|uniref:BTAD domain-containing protein n=1 Tax=Paenibacillus sp. Leaf72 TaxID=1736234 RepID=UPI0006F8924E|nr:BTAD domain-containing protein [Paenibacillus sp. Leaf72]KQN97103.1 hypothetical protein ASF12_23885 [Paenibacillus sp. Leaf72]
MLNVAVVDDEHWALEEMKEYLSNCEGIGSIQLYDDPLEGLAAIKREPPDVVFIDIYMPQISGLMFAEEMLAYCPGTATVFVTAFDNHALQAYELNVEDYILKPVAPQRLQRTVERVRQRRIGRNKLAAEAVKQKDRVDVQCFGKLNLYGTAGPVKWKVLKTKELFAYLWTNRECRVENIMDDVFPGMEDTKARAYIHTCVYQLRQLLKRNGLDGRVRIKSLREKYILTAEHMSSDMLEFQQLAKRAVDMGSLFLLRQAVNLYKEEVLTDIQSVWVYRLREHYRLIGGLVVERLVEELLNQGDILVATDYALEYLNKEPYDEGALWLVVRCYKRGGNRVKADTVFKQFCKRSAGELGACPHAELVDRYESLMQST